MKFWDIDPGEKASDDSPILSRREMLALVGINTIAIGVLQSAATEPAPPTSRSDRVEFTRLIAHWDGDDDYLAFVDDARPEIYQIGFYGGHFYSLFAMNSLSTATNRR